MQFKEKFNFKKDEFKKIRFDKKILVSNDKIVNSFSGGDYFINKGSQSPGIKKITNKKFMNFCKSKYTYP